MNESKIIVCRSNGAHTKSRSHTLLPRSTVNMSLELPIYSNDAHLTRCGHNSSAIMR
jgi:hypothetical protein